MGTRSMSAPRKVTWKDALVRAVFDWQVYAIEQPDRAPGWTLAATTVVKFFSKDGGANTSLHSAAHLDGPVSHTLHFGEADGLRWEPASSTETPWDLLDRLRDVMWELRLTLPDQTLGFGSPRYAMILAAQAVLQVAQEYACPHPSWAVIYGGGRDEPPWEGRRCRKCRLEREYHEEFDDAAGEHPVDPIPLGEPPPIEETEGKW